MKTRPTVARIKQLEFQQRELQDALTRADKREGDAIAQLEKAKTLLLRAGQCLAGGQGDGAVMQDIFQFMMPKAAPVNQEWAEAWKYNAADVAATSAWYKNFVADPEGAAALKVEAAKRYLNKAAR